MAKAYFNNDGNVVKISTDSDASNLNLNVDNHTVENISDSDFNSLRQRSKIVSLSGDSVTFEDASVTYDNQDQLSDYLNNNLIPIMDQFLQNNESNGMYDAINNYKNICKNTDLSTITYPLNSSWEKYCEDNSITYYHPLQIP